MLIHNNPTPQLDMVVFQPTDFLNSISLWFSMVTQPQQSATSTSWRGLRAGTTTGSIRINKRSPLSPSPIPTNYSSLVAIALTLRPAWRVGARRNTFIFTLKPISASLARWYGAPGASAEGSGGRGLESHTMRSQVCTHVGGVSHSLFALVVFL